MGIKSLRKIQLGKETDPGTAVAATTLWRGMGVTQDAQELQFVEEDIGVLAQPDSAYIPKLEAGFEFEEVDATFEQLPYILAAGVKNVVTGTRDGEDGDAYIYDYPMPMAVANTIKTFTIEGGDDEGAEEVEYCFVKEFNLSGAAGESIKMNGTWEGRQASPTTFTPAISVPSTEVMLFNKGKFYIDEPVTGNFGVTRKTDTLLSFELSVTTGWIARWTCDEQLYFRFVRSTRPEVSLSLNMEHNAVAIAEKAKARETGGKARLIRLLFEGSTFTNPGDNYTKKTLIIDMVGKYTSIPSLEDEEGDNVLNFELQGLWMEDAVAGPPPADAYLDIKVVNALTALP